MCRSVEMDVTAQTALERTQVIMHDFDGSEGQSSDKTECSRDNAIEAVHSGRRHVQDLYVQSSHNEANERPRYSRCITLTSHLETYPTDGGVCQ